ncbi:VCBS domain-containing protein, partial [Vibrio superstes]
PQTLHSPHGSVVIDENGNWVFTANNQHHDIQALGAGDTLTEVVTVTSKDGTATQDITVTINGNNDVPSISGGAKGGVTEDTDAQTLSTNGDLIIRDVDTGESHFQPQTMKSAHGEFQIDADGHWTFTADNTQAAIQSLGAHSTLTETATVTSQDGTATQQLTVTVQGVNDVPKITGKSTALVTEDATSPTLSVAGKLDIADLDTGESFFK